MNRYFLIINLIFISMAMNSCSKKMECELPKLIDRDLFFGNPEISGGQLSPDGKYVAFMKEYNGIMNIWVKEFDATFDEARPLTDSERPLYGFFWSGDGKYLLYVKDKDGDENMNIFAVNPADEVEKGAIPVSRNLTDFDEVTAQIYQVSDNDHDLLFIGLNNRDKAWHDLYSLRISTGALEKLYENNDRIVGYDFDWDDNLRIYYRTDEQGNTAMLYKKGDSLVKIYETTVTETAYAAGWNEDNSKFYLVTNVGDLDLSTLYLMDPETEKMQLIESDPENRVDFGGLSLDQNTRKIIGTSYTDDKTRRYFKDKEREAIYKHLREQFPGREVDFVSTTKDYSMYLVSVWGDKYASEVWLYIPEHKDLIQQYVPRPKLKEIETLLSPMEPIRYKSSDGMEIPGYLTIPNGCKAQELPLVVLVHGGPKGPRDYWGFDPIVQFLANRGYAVLQPNFRASGGYGKKFQNAGDLQWGLLMQDDITWGVKHLIDEGIVDKSKVAIMGGSYGGYATLAGLAFTPDLYAAGVDIVGPSNIFTLLESIPPYWEAGRAFLHGMVGDPETKEGEKRIREASPLFSAEKITKPLLIIQGANDPRVKQAEADQIVVALRDKGQQVSYILADDEGHGFAKPVNKMAMFAEIERFLAPILGGRFQEEMPDDVAKRLKEITIDITTVVHEPAGAVKAADKLPKIQTNALVEGRYTYEMNIEVQDQNIKMSTKRTIEKSTNGWKVTDASSGAMGDMNDEVILDANFNAVSRILTQMGQNITMTYKKNQVLIDMAGKEQKISYTGAFLASSPGNELLMANLNLEKGEKITLATDDIQSMKAKFVTVEYIGEKEFEGEKCQVMEVTDANNKKEKSTYYFINNNSVLYFMESLVPAMNNAKITMRLSKNS
jgi:dipeptidyl aminopeptidase/acylaminoacyl peptidase